MTSHCNGYHSKTSLSVSLPSSIMSQSILCNCFKVCTKFLLEGTERLTRSDGQRQVVPQKSTREGYACFEHVYPWPRFLEWHEGVCVYRLDMYSGASLLRTLYVNNAFLYSDCFCRLILSSFNFWSVVTVVSGKTNFTALLCKEFNLF